MASKCININCKFPPQEQLKSASLSVSTFYRVPHIPHYQVCSRCLKKCKEYFGRVKSCIRNSQCMFDVLTNGRPDFIDLVEDTDNSNPLPSIENEQENQLLKDFSHLKPLFDEQMLICENRVIEKRKKVKEMEQSVVDLAQELDIKLSKYYKNLYNYENVQYEHEQEVCIIDDDKKELMTVFPEKYNVPKDLPPKSFLERCLIKLGDKVYVNKFSKSLPWVEGTVNFIFSLDKPRYLIKFEDNQNTVSYGLKELAYKDTSKIQYKVGTRVIVNFHDSNPDMTNEFYAGIVGEPPTQLNYFRYLIFFDDGYVQYADHKEIRLVCYQSSDVSADVDANAKEFIKSYLLKYPERPLVKFTKNQLVRTDYEGRWHRAKVLNIDASLVQVKFINSENKHTEWIYRGSNRLEPIYSRENKTKFRTSSSMSTRMKKTFNKPYVELEYEATEQRVVETDNYQPLIFNDFGVIKTIEIPAYSPQPIPFKDHECNCFCVSRVKYNVNQTTLFNTLSVPLHFGFKRHVITTNNNLETKVTYSTPCGRVICNDTEMYNYLKATYVQNNDNMTVDMFDFDFRVNPLAVYSVYKSYGYENDISGGLEIRPISAVDSFQNSLPPKVQYITERQIMPGVNLNLDTKFLCSCDCADNCEDRTKCSCWQLTLAGTKYNLGNISGYHYKRLYGRLDTGIFECNVNCNCSKNCLNRVVQHPVSAKLQVFKTKNKGWGIRTLTDIPKGSFICNYLGEIYNENDAEKIACDTGENGEYLSNLDYIDTVLELKEGYEKDVIDPSHVESESEEDTNFHLDFVEKNEQNFTMNLRNLNIQHSNTESNGKHQLLQLSSQQTTPMKTLDNYFYCRHLDENTDIFVVDAKKSGNVSRFFNHSCEPNVFVQNVFVDTHDLRFPWQAYFASCFISSGTELVYDYGYEVGSVDGKILYCHCGSTNCKGRLL